jgi:hypothetical protein
MKVVRGVKTDAVRENVVTEHWVKGIAGTDFMKKVGIKLKVGYRRYGIVHVL